MQLGDLNFEKKKPIKCKHCKKIKGEHRAVTFQCPMGLRSRIGYTMYQPNQTFEPK